MDSATSPVENSYAYDTRSAADKPWRVTQPPLQNGRDLKSSFRSYGLLMVPAPHRHEVLSDMVTRKPLPEDANKARHGSPQVRSQRPGQAISSNSYFHMTPESIRVGDEGQHETAQSWSGSRMANDSLADRAGRRPEVDMWFEESDHDEDTIPNAGLKGSMPRVPPVPKLSTRHHEGIDPTEQNSSPSATDRRPSITKPGRSSSRQEMNLIELEVSTSQTKTSSDATSRALSRKPSGPCLPPSAALSAMNLGESNKTSGGNTFAAPKLAGPDFGEDIWEALDAVGQDSTMPARGSPGLVSLPSEGEADAWDRETKQDSMPSQSKGIPEEGFRDSHPWDDVGSVDKGKAPAKFREQGEPGGGAEDWVDVEPSEPSRQNARDVSKGRQQSEASGSSRMTPQRRVSKSETYQIKNITWRDASAPDHPRQSPILVQNENGPCPLVALVNALILTTPAGLDTALVGTLRSREQVSLSLLLDAVFDELISARRTAEGSELPDITELYSFLLGLHTGMNVNPRFIPTPEVMAAFKRTSLTHLHPTQRGDLIPGTFEKTNEMALYSTFAIPLIHGWLPYTEEAAYGALKRHAASYEDAQRLLFREEELEEKLSNPEHKGLTDEEQSLYQDILHIKSFLDVSATQLTRWGLEVITKAMKPGSVAILFRNDHFSTLYRHPQTLQLLALVTDAGYASHGEIVWESIVDVKGENAEFLSGDFRVVGENGNPSWSSGQANQGQGQGQSQSQSQGQGQGCKDGHNSQSVAHEQEDMDLALALQLQEEEEQRVREQEARRRQESQLSEHFIEQQGRTPAPTPRGGRSPALGTPRSAKTGFRAAVAAGLSRRSSASTPAPTNGSNNIMAPLPLPPPPPPPRNRAPSAGSTMANANANALGIIGGGGPPRPRQGPGNHSQNVRSLLPHAGQAVNQSAAAADDDNDDDDAPPSYEQAAKMPLYQPPAGHPSHSGSSPDTGRGGGGGGVGGESPGMSRQYGPPSAGRVPSGGGAWPGSSGSPARVRPPPVGGANGDGSGRDKDCVVM